MSGSRHLFSHSCFFKGKTWTRKATAGAQQCRNLALNEQKKKIPTELVGVDAKTLSCTFWRISWVGRTFFNLFLKLSLFEKPLVLYNIAISALSNSTINDNASYFCKRTSKSVCWQPASEMLWKRLNRTVPNCLYKLNPQLKLYGCIFSWATGNGNRTQL